MVTILVEVVVVVMWSAVLFLHTRRLMRLANAVALSPTPQSGLRRRLHRAWWWLGREEFWRGVQQDGVSCIQLTVMLFMLGLSA